MYIAVKLSGEGMQEESALCGEGAVLHQVEIGSMTFRPLCLRLVGTLARARRAGHGGLHCEEPCVYAQRRNAAVCLVAVYTAMNRNEPCES